MIFFSNCRDCALRREATEDVLSAIRLRRGMSLTEIRHYLFGRHGFRFEKADELVREPKEAKFIKGNVKRSTVAGQQGGNPVG